MESAADLVAATERDGVEFLFAMFVDMHGKPCAKMVPVSAIEGLMADGAGFAGFAAGPMGQTPVVARHPGHARPELVHAGAVAARPRHHPVRPPRAGRAVAVRPRVILRRQLERLADRRATRSRWAPRRSTSWCGGATTGGIAVADPHGPGQGALLRRPGPHADVRPPDDGVAPHEHARAGPTTPTTTRTPTASSSRTSATPTR